MKKIFTETELAQIKTAVGEAEKTTSAEIVPVFFESCGSYTDTFWKSGILFATLWSFGSLIYYNFSAHTWGLSRQYFFMSIEYSTNILLQNCIFSPFRKTSAYVSIPSSNSSMCFAFKFFADKRKVST